MTTIPLQGRKRFSTELLYRSEKLTYLLPWKLGRTLCYTIELQYRSKVLVHFPRYCRGGIAVCIFGLTSGKPRLTSLKTQVLPRFFAVKNTAVNNWRRCCLNSLLFPLFQRLINFTKRDVAHRWFYDVIHFTFVFTVIHKPWLLSTFENADVSRRKKRKLVSFATARRNKSDIIEIELLRYIPPDVHWKGQISHVMQSWYAFELKLTSGYISLFLTNSFTVGIDFEFQHEFHLLLQLSSKDSVREGSRKVRFAPTSLAQIYFETHSMQTQIQCNALWTKNNLRKKLAILL